ncbi:flagellar basal body L-ring protein FlgH [Planktotalea sp.]|uniref:flagellar basal body L-ring protein FlgH n=1 Tax=Planktotalea sp. TaxID=2029877 RepID=UPI003F6C08D3
MSFITKAFAPLLLCALGACSTYVEDEASRAFQPVMPEALYRTGPADGSIYHANAPGLFAVEQRASKVGDILTIALNESFQATKSQTATAAKSDSLSLSVPNLLNVPVASTGSAQNFEGNGAAEQSNSFTGLVTVSVVRVMSNGNLEVLGQKKLTLNNGDEYVRVSGLVRQSDISPTNVVNSNRLANAEITYIGAGDLADTAKRGWIPKAFSSLNAI